MVVADNIFSQTIMSAVYLKGHHEDLYKPTEKKTETLMYFYFLTLLFECVFITLGFFIQNLNNIRKQARALTTFIGMIPYRMPGDTHTRLVHLQSLMI